jgi:hypothetical protein
VLTVFEQILSVAARSRSFRSIVEQSAATVRTHRQKLLRHTELLPVPNPNTLAAMRDAIHAFTDDVAAKTPQATA